MDVKLKDFTIFSDETTYKNLKFFQSLKETLVRS